MKGRRHDTKRRGGGGMKGGTGKHSGRRDEKGKGGKVGERKR